MWLWYDWQAAAVADDEGIIYDQAVWDGFYDQRAVIERLHRVANNSLTREAQVLLERFPDAIPTVHGNAKLPDAQWPLPSNEAVKAVDKAAIEITRQGVAKAAGDPDRRLEHLLRASDEMRSTYLTMESRLSEWVGLFLPALRFGQDRDRLPRLVKEADSLKILADKLSVEQPDDGPSKLEWKSLRDWGESTASFKSKLARLENAIRELAQNHLPSLSMMLGPLLAARLCVEAHGRMRLARLPAGTVQVLGAEKAFFNHLKTGASPPKHGHIFMHPWISRSPRWVRGKSARTIAAKASIAAKVDAFEGEPWTEEMVAIIDQKITEIKAAHPKPIPKNR